MALNTSNSNKPRSVSGSKANSSNELYHQFVFTHCRQDESCNGEAGFQMRLRSSDDGPMQDFTAKLSYEPLDTQMQDPSASPRRLAWLKYPGDGNDMYVLAHSRYLGRDTEGRWGNFLTRTIFFPVPLPRTLSRKRVLQCCDSPLWNELDFGNSAIERSARFAGIPAVGSTINDHQLQAFLRDEHFPGRAGTITPRHRQQLLEWTVTACLTALNVSPDRHVYIHGEPQLVAMLLYGMATVLPEAITEHLTFSTYEKPGQLLRSFCSAIVIGTITDHPEHGLNDAFLETQGMLIDTFTHHYSNESEQQSFTTINDYISLVTEGKLRRLSHLHALATLDPQALHQSPGNSLDEAWNIFEVHRTLSTRRQSMSDSDIVKSLSETASTTLGKIVLSANPAQGTEPDIAQLQGNIRRLLWTAMREQCMRLPERCKHFENFLKTKAARKEHLRVVTMLLASNNASWEQSWQLYRNLDQQGATVAFDTLLDSVGNGRGDAGSIDLNIRIDVLREFRNLNRVKEPLPQKRIWLLRLRCADEVWDFDGLRTSKRPLPEEWIGQAMEVSIADETKSAIVPLLLQRKEEADDDSSSWWNGFRSAYHNEDSSESRRQTLKLIFESEPDEVIDLFFLLSHRLQFRHDDLEEPFLRRLLEDYWEKLKARRLGRYGWMHHWSNMNKVEAFLPYFRENEISERIWDTILESIGLGLLCENKEHIISKIRIDEWSKKRLTVLPRKTLDQLRTINDKCDILSSHASHKRYWKLIFASCVCLAAYTAVWLLSIWGNPIVNHIKHHLLRLAGWLGL